GRRNARHPPRRVDRPPLAPAGRGGSCDAGRLAEQPRCPRGLRPALAGGPRSGSASEHLRRRADATGPPVTPVPPHAPASRHLRPVDLVAALAIGAVIVAYLAYGLFTAGKTLGCDFLAYFNASVNWYHHQPIYDLAVSSTGTCGTYQYPPPFVLLAAPFSLFGFDTGNGLWIAFLL